MLDKSTNPLQSATPESAHSSVKRRRRESWRDCEAVSEQSVADVRARLPRVTYTVLALLDLDASLLWKPERDRLRLIVYRIIGPVGPQEVGRAVSDLNALRRRRFPVRAFDEPRAPRAARNTAREVLTSLRERFQTTRPNALDESLFVEETLNFLESRSSRG